MNSKKILYFGLDPTRYPQDVVHYPLIKTQVFEFEKIKIYFESQHTHVLFTSREAVKYFFQYEPKKNKIYLCVGEATAKRVEGFGAQVSHIAEEAHGEGVIEMLHRLKWGRILYPHSAQARSLLPDYLKERGIPFALYDTIPCVSTLPDLNPFDRLVFTSPSTVEVFASLCKSLPPQEKCEAIGPITKKALEKLFCTSGASSK